MRQNQTSKQHNSSNVKHNTKQQTTLTNILNSQPFNYIVQYTDRVLIIL